MILRDGLPCGDDHFGVFSTGSVPPAFRTECWAGIIARYFGPFETRAIGDMPFEAALATRTVSFLRVFRIIPLMVPLVLIALRRASTIALALDLRAFGARPDRTFFVEVQRDPLDLGLRAVGLCAATLVVIAAIAGWI